MKQINPGGAWHSVDGMLVNNASALLEELLRNGNAGKKQLFAWFNAEFSVIIETQEQLSNLASELDDEQITHLRECGAEQGVDCFVGVNCKCECHKSDLSQ